MTWYDLRTGTAEIYAQRVSSAGSLMWGSGVIISADAGDEYNSRRAPLVSDGSGGAIITWGNYRPSDDHDLFAQRVNASGVPQWTETGVTVCANDKDQGSPQIVSDGSGGAIISWVEGGYSDISAQRLNSSGVPQWAVDGVIVCTSVLAVGGSYATASDWAGGVTITWQDDRSAYHDIYAQRINSSGVAQWTTNGVSVCGAAGQQQYPTIASDTAGSIITWQDWRSGGSCDIYAQRLGLAGAPQWATNGKEICTATGDQRYPCIASDALNSAVVAWQDPRSGIAQIYAQRISESSANPPTVLTGAAASITNSSVMLNGTITSSGGENCSRGFMYKEASEASWHNLVMSGTQGSGEFAAPLSNLTSNSTYQYYAYATNSAGSGEGLPAKTFVTQSASFFYFAEGFTGTGFQEYLCLGNPGSSAAKATVTYLFNGSGSTTDQVNIPANSRATVDVNAEAGAGREVSVKVESASEIVCERPMYFNYNGLSGGSDVVGATSPATTWYFAEGYTGAGFDEYITVLNPSTSDANLTFHFQTQEAGEIVKTGQVAKASSRATFRINDLLGTGYQTSLKLESSQPVVAERPIYFDYLGASGDKHWSGGHCVVGASSLVKNYLFAEGNTLSNFDEYLTLQNPGTSKISVSATYQMGSGQGDSVTESYGIDAGRRLTLFVPGEAGGGKDVSVSLSSASYFLAERPMYFDYQGWTGGHCVIGASGAAGEWFFAEGCTSATFHEYLCLQNPGAQDAAVEITYLTQEAGALVAKTTIVPANSRITVLVNANCGGSYSLSARIRVTSGPGIIVERPMYFNYLGWDGGHDVVGYTP